MLAPGRATYEGQHAHVRDAIHEPKGLQQPRIPILVGGNGPKVTWRLAARFADELNLDALTPSQVEHLDRWGYPYVMEEFRFHMTLTGRLAAERREPILTMLRNSFSTVGLKTLAIDRIAVLRQENAESRFRIVKDWQLRKET